ncbi:MAG: helix-turn-helix domain-containing protein [Candidatus Pacearchaeota archaeon]
MEEINTKEYYTTEEIAEHWKVEPRTIQREVRRGKLTAVRIGRQFRIKGENILEYETRNSYN